MTDGKGNPVIDPKRVTKVVLVTEGSQRGDTVTDVAVYTDLLELANDLAGSHDTWPEFDAALVQQGDDPIQPLDVRGTYALAIRALFSRYIDSLSKIMMRDVQRETHTPRNVDDAMPVTPREISAAMAKILLDDAARNESRLW